MTDVEAKKAEISSLWGIPTEQIDQKLRALKAIITDSTDYSLIELLLRCDLNIETAIGRHFSGNTPSPSPQSYHQNQQNATSSNMKLRVDEYDHHTESGDDESSRSPQTNSVTQTASSSSPSSGSPFRSPHYQQQSNWVLSKEAIMSPFRCTSSNALNRKQSTPPFDDREEDTLPPTPSSSPPSSGSPFRPPQSEEDTISPRIFRCTSSNALNRIQSTPPLDDRKETEDILPPKSPTIIRRKRIRNKTESISAGFEDEESESENMRPRKRRKICDFEKDKIRMNESLHSNSHNNNYTDTTSTTTTNTTTTISSNSNNTKQNDSNLSSYSKQNPIRSGSPSGSTLPPTLSTEDQSTEDESADDEWIVDLDWKQKTMGTVIVKYEDLYEKQEANAGSRSPGSYLNGFCIAKNIKSLKDLVISVAKGKIRIIELSPQMRTDPFDGESLLYHELVRYCVRKIKREREELRSRLKTYKKFRVKMPNFEPTPQNEVQAELSKKKRELVDKDAFEYTVEINVAFNRRSTRSLEFKIESPLCVAAFCQSEQLSAETLKCHYTPFDLVNKGHTFTMQSLLDFTCRYSHDPNDRSDNYNHGLNVTLHQYQLQSLRWMIEEENHPNGFYRHLYYEGCFGDDAPFIFSPVFNRLVFNGSVPVAHGGLLCEEMGLGKTIISLALIHAQKPRDLSGYSTKTEPVIAHSDSVRTWYKSAATLIIAPCSLVGQWETECDTRSEGRLKWKRYYGANRSRNIADYIESDIVFTTYGIIAKESGERRIDLHKQVLQGIEWHRIILDESHSIKNKQTKQSKSIAKLRGKNRWCLTGTPFGTKVVDLENQLRFIGLQAADLRLLDLKAVSGAKVFQPDSAKTSKQRSEASKNAKKAEALLPMIGRLIMRHKKDQKFNDKAIVSMPDKEENEIFIDFSPTQKRYYDKLYKSAKERYDYYSSINSVSRASLQILSALHPARSACSGFVCSKEEIDKKLSAAEAQSYRVRSMVHQVAEQNISSKELFEMAAEKAFADKDGECPICYECPLDDPLQTPCRHLFCGECIMNILREKPECPMCRRRVNPKDLKKPKMERKDGSVMGGEELNEEEEAARKQNDTVNDGDDIIRFDAKINRLMAELTKIKRDRPNEKSLIFTSFSKSLDWICSELKRNGFSYRTLTGNMTMNKRKKQLDQFANDDDVKVFVLTVRAGAVGITLTAANHVFVMEPTLNPALHRQAINRVYRLGQKRKVMIHTMIMRDSIEERIWNVIHKGDENVDQRRGGSGQDIDTLHSGECNNIAGNINNDGRARLESSVIDRLFQ